MRRFTVYFALGVVGFVLALMAGCKAATPPPPPAPEFRPTATIKEIMDSLVDRNADVIWESVATVVDKGGVDERRPRTDEEWAVVKRSAISLIEATNLLLLDRKTGKPGDKSENPNIELEPAQIDELRAKDPEAWKTYVKGLYDAVLPALNAINAKNADELLNTGEAIDTACENCHLHYWYPGEKAPAQAPSTKGE